MLAQSSSIGRGIEYSAIPREYRMSASNAMEHSPNALNSIMPNVVHDLRNILTTLNAGVRMLGARVGRERQEMLLAGMDQTLSTAEPSPFWKFPRGPSPGVPPSMHSSRETCGED
ncbi:hypothetical protein [Rhizorhapis sp. SPR117]|uniref:hypothetical protein n=1 Tax=Rhizorhapis sp. SPR117 TaxID=2912611 RepID=UPI001F1EF428|nr:hypothetical protein [Rhizorhapis sp. SPR117]